jgi:hypothetical protein
MARKAAVDVRFPPRWVVAPITPQSTEDIRKKSDRYAHRLALYPASRNLLVDCQFQIWDSGTRLTGFATAEKLVGVPMKVPLMLEWGRQHVSSSLLKTSIDEYLKRCANIILVYSTVIIKVWNIVYVPHNRILILSITSLLTVLAGVLSVDGFRAVHGFHRAFGQGFIKEDWRSPFPDPFPVLGSAGPGRHAEASRILIRPYGGSGGNPRCFEMGGARRYYNSTGEATRCHMYYI